MEDHLQIVVAVAAGNGVIAHGLQRLDGGELGVRAPHDVACDVPVLIHLQCVAQQGGVSQLLHQGHAELIEGVAEDHHLRHAAQLIQKFLRTGQGVDLGDDVLDLPQLHALFPQQVDAPAHQLVVVRLVPGGAAQLGDAALLGKGDPDLGDEDALHIQTDNVHKSGSFLTSSALPPAHNPAWRPCR